MRGGVVWITGLAAPERTLLGRRVFRALRESRRACVLLDGDELGGVLVPAPGASEADHDAYYETLARLAALLARQDQLVVVTAATQRRAWRERADALAPHFVEVFVATPGGPGTFEPSAAPDVVARGGLDELALAGILRRVDLSGAGGKRFAPIGQHA